MPTAAVPGGHPAPGETPLYAAPLSPVPLPLSGTGEPGALLRRLAELSEHTIPVTISEDSLHRVEMSSAGLARARATRPVYGASTGVGANRTVAVPAGARHTLPLRLLRSHCAATGPLEDHAVTGLAMLIRLNQLTIGRSGVSRQLVEGLLAAVNAGAEPAMHQRGSLGTADIAQLAELALTLTGERPWRRRPVPPVAIAETDALPFMSSSAVTLSSCVLAIRKIDTVLKAGEAVAALSFLALAGSREAWSEEVHRTRSHPAQREVAGRMRALVRATGPHVAAARVQDPFSLRTFPVVHAPALAALHDLTVAVELECTSASENPLVLDGDRTRHHGLFHLATVSALLDRVRITVLSVANLAAARASLLCDPAVNGSTAFLTDGEPGSSGLMIGEYVTQDALAMARTFATPTSTAPVSISLGVEEHASFASQGARQLHALADQVRTIVAVEALSAVRALTLVPGRRTPCRALEIFDALAARVSPGFGDKPIGDDLSRVDEALDVIADRSPFATARES